MLIFNYCECLDRCGFKEDAEGFLTQTIIIQVGGMLSHWSNFVALV
jgi:hypothetical protein